jgi:hypothetical protein
MGQMSGQFVKPKKIAVKGPLKDSWVIELLFISLSSKSDPLKAATDWSFCSFIERNTGSIKKKNIVKHPVNTAIEVFNFIIVKLYIGTI